MSRDVYAGDDDLNSQAKGSGHGSTAHIVVRADVDPQVLLQVAAQLNLLNAVPLLFSLHRQPDNQVIIQISVCDCTDFAVEMVCRKLERLTCVYDVMRDRSALGTDDPGRVGVAWRLP